MNVGKWQLLSSCSLRSFKGLEADVVLLCGGDGKLPGCSPASLSVGAKLARVIIHDEIVESCQRMRPESTKNINVAEM